MGDSGFALYTAVIPSIEARRVQALGEMKVNLTCSGCGAPDTEAYLMNSFSTICDLTK